jgi:hypothetical protein
MSTQIASQPHINCVKEMANEPLLVTAPAGTALKHMDLSTFDILNIWHWLEECIYRCIPFFAQPVWNLGSVCRSLRLNISLTNLFFIVLNNFHLIIISLSPIAIAHINWLFFGIL